MSCTPFPISSVSCIKTHKHSRWCEYNHLAVSGSVDGVIRIWGIHKGKGGVEISKLKHGSLVYSVSFSPHCGKLVSGSWDKTVRVWCVESGRELTRMKHDDTVCVVAWAPDGGRIASGSMDKRIIVWDTDSGTNLIQMRYTHRPTSLSWSPDGTKLVAGYTDGSMKGFCSVTGDILFNIGHKKWVTTVSWSPTSTRIVSGSLDKTIRVWETGSSNSVGELICINVEEMSGYPTSIDWSPDGMSLVSGHSHHDIWLWDIVSGVGMVVPVKYIPKPHHTMWNTYKYSCRSKITSVVWVPGTNEKDDCGLILYGSDDGYIRVMDE